ncbi:MAG: hypothetical protein ABI665_21025 [Vicinamibacterales bacterium]
MTRWICGGVVVMTMLGAALSAQGPGAVAIRVKETAGIRRNGYPAHARVPIPRGAMANPTKARLMLNGKEVPGQYTAIDKWPDGSVQALDVDFNASVAPGEETTFQLEYGPEIKAEVTARGLVVSETPEHIQVGTVKFSKTAMPLLASVNYRQEDIGPGPNGFAITDAVGASYDMSTAEAVKAEIVKGGPLFVVLRYTGQLPLSGGGRLPFTIIVEMPNSKTWWKATATFDDPGQRVRSIAFHSPLALGAFPWVWDFGTGSWSYGSLRNKTDSVVFMQAVTSAPRKAGVDVPEGKWEILTGPKGQEQPYEATAGRRPGVAEGWGHIQDAKEAIAFAVEDFGREPGTYTISLDGEGHMAVQLVPARPGTRHQLAVYQHFVATPVPIGAVTSPVSMLSPLMVTLAKSSK